MPVLFEANAGRIVALSEPGGQGIMPLVKLDPAITFQDRKSLITQVSVAQNASFQFLHTLGGDIFVYVFGDRVGQVSIGGLCGARGCPAGGDDGAHGAEKMLAWYADNKLSKRQKPVTILIGRTPLTGFVLGISTGVVDPRLLLVQFNLTLAVVPDK